MNWTYAAIMAVAIATAAVLSRGRQRGLQLSAGQRWGIACGAFCGAMIGAKAPFVVLDWEGLTSGRAWLADGKTLMFGLVGGYLGVELAKWSLGVRVKTGDSFALPVAVGIGIGRLACFAAGCCFGLPTELPWGVNFGDGVRRHPTQLYEAAFHFAAAYGLWGLERRGRWRGQLIKLYILAYLAYRFASEYVRPEERLAAGLTFYHWSALALAPLFVALWLRDRRALAAGR